MSLNKALIHVSNLHKKYVMGDETLFALHNVNLEIESNDYIAIVGSSGSGKSTLMNMLGCLDEPSEGQYILNGINIHHLSDNQLADIRNNEIGFIFQNFNLIPRQTALHNVMQPLIYLGYRLKERKKLASEALERVGLSLRMNHLPNQLSGGQRQRVSFARALVCKPSIILADEPTGNLDSQNTSLIMSLLEELHHDGNTIILVTHESDIAQRAKRIIQMEDGSIISDRMN